MVRPTAATLREWARKRVRDAEEPSDDDEELKAVKELKKAVEEESAAASAKKASSVTTARKTLVVHMIAIAVSLLFCGVFLFWAFKTNPDDNTPGWFAGVAFGSLSLALLVSACAEGLSARQCCRASCAHGKNGHVHRAFVWLLIMALVGAVLIIIDNFFGFNTLVMELIGAALMLGLLAAVVAAGALFTLEHAVIKVFALNRRISAVFSGVIATGEDAAGAVVVVLWASFILMLLLFYNDRLDITGVHIFFSIVAMIATARVFSVGVRVFVSFPFVTRTLKRRFLSAMSGELLVRMLAESVKKQYGIDAEFAEYWRSLDGDIQRHEWGRLWRYIRRYRADGHRTSSYERRQQRRAAKKEGKVCLPTATERGIARLLACVNTTYWPLTAGLSHLVGPQECDGVERVDIARKVWVDNVRNANGVTSDDILRIFQDRENLSATLADLWRVLEKVEAFVFTFGLLAVLYTSVGRFRNNYIDVWVAISTFVVAFAVVFGELARTSLSCLSFIFLQHAYGIGDTVKLGSDPGRRCVVQRIHLLTTDFYCWTGELLTMQNQSLAQMAIFNLSSCKYRRVVADCLMSVDRVHSELVECMQEELREYTQRHTAVYKSTKHVTVQAREFVHNFDDGATKVRVHFRANVKVPLAEDVKGSLKIESDFNAAVASIVKSASHPQTLWNRARTALTYPAATALASPAAE